MLPPRNRPRRRLFLSLAMPCALAIASCASVRPAAAVEPAAVLHLASGDFLTGQWQDGSDPALLRWQPPFATDAYEFPWHSIAMVTLPAPQEQVKPTGEFCIELNGGDVLFGDLKTLDDKWLTINTTGQEQTALGTLQVRRSSVRRITRWSDGDDLVYLGPNGLAEWRVKPADQWQQNLGTLSTHTRFASIYRDVALPDRACIEIELAWNEKADFSLLLGVTEKEQSVDQAFSFEVAADAIVVMRELEATADLALLKSIDKGAGRAHYVLYLDQKLGRLIVATPAGEQVADLQVAGPKMQRHGGVQLVNRKGDVRLQRLRISRWNGQPPVKTIAGKTNLLLQDGSALSGKLTRFSGGSFHLESVSKKQSKAAPAAGQGSQPPSQSPARQTLSIAAAAVADIALATDAQPPAGRQPPTNQARVTLHDGSRLRGKLLGVKAHKLHLDCPALARPLAISLTVVRSVAALDDAKAQTPQPDERQSDNPAARFETANAKMKGRLLPNDDGGTAASCLAWKPRDSANAVPLRNDANGRIVYHDPPIKVVVKPHVQIRQARPQPRVVRQPGLVGGLLNAFSGGSAAASSDASGPAMYLRTGDKLPCRVESIDQRGVTFKSPSSSATFIANENVKAIELIAHGVDGRVTSERRDRLLTLPRMQRDNPPTHLLVSVYGDYLRCRLLSLDDDWATVEIRLEQQKIERRRIARIIWLDPPPRQPAASEADEKAAAKNADGNDSPPAVKRPAQPAAGDDSLRVQAVRSDGVRLTFRPEQLAGQELTGVSDVLAECQVSLNNIDELLLGDYIERAAAELAYQRWKMHDALQPKEDNGEGAAASSQLVGQPAPDVEIPWVAKGKLQRGKPFKISDYQGKVLVLDFWASWCGPCAQAMPKIDRLAKEFAERNVVVVAVNMQETPDKIAAALDRLEIDPKVAVDRDGVAAQRYQVSGIPQTVVIAPDGAIAKVFIGGGPKFEAQLRAVLEELSKPKK